MSLSAMNFFKLEREESPRPTKRRNSGPIMEQTPRPPFSLSLEPPAIALPKRGRLLPKTPLAPRPAAAKPIAFRQEEPSPSIFLPSTDKFDEVRTFPMTARLKPRAMMIPKLNHKKVVTRTNSSPSSSSNTLLEIANAKPLQRSKAVPAPSRATLERTRSCHALCA